MQISLSLSCELVRHVFARRLSTLELQSEAGTMARLIGDHSQSQAINVDQTVERKVKTFMNLIANRSRRGAHQSKR